ncbi:MAG: GtrA family protein [Bacteroidales bacterium]|nr:GtrA family protein [Bacteroidales bacterium]
MGSLIKEAFSGRSDDVKVQVFRYGIAGLTAATVDTGLLALLTELFGENLLLLWTAIAFACGLATTYILSIKWVFSNRTMSQAAELTIFIIIGLVGLGLTELLVWVFAIKLEWHYLLAKITAATTVFIWNFTAKKLLLFRNK